MRRLIALVSLPCGPARRTSADVTIVAALSSPRVSPAQSRSHPRGDYYHMQRGRSSRRCHGLARDIAATWPPCAALSSTDVLSPSPNRGAPLGTLDDRG